MPADYAQPLLDEIDPQNEIFSARLYRWAPEPPDLLKAFAEHVCGSAWRVLHALLSC